MSIFEKYGLKINDISGSKVVFTDDDSLRILSHFLDYWNKPKYIKLDLLPELDAVISGQTDFNDIGADVVGVALIEKDKTQLTSSELGFPDFELPTPDFVCLIRTWLLVLENRDAN